jgi:hypothetical protein
MMLLSTWWHRLGRGFRTSGRPHRCAPARRFRPRLEVLETRQLLSTFTVVLATDSGGPGGQKVTATSGDLRYCIAQADAAHSATSDTINFSPTLFATPHTITLNNANPPLVVNDSHPLTINGPTGGTATVSGGDAVEVFDVTGGTVSIRNLAIAHGHTSGSGGGISNAGTLTLTNCTLDHDTAGNAGGGLSNLGGTATLVGCTFNHDSAGSTGGIGGGIFSFGTLSVTSSNLSNDSAGFLGGGIYIHVNSTATLTNCTLSNDSATDGGGDGGGVFVDDNSTATLTNCTLSNDKAGNGGGGVCTDGTHSTATLTNCTLSNDSATQGGGICNTGGTVALTNCALSNDSDSGLLNEGTATVTACTFSNDSAVQGGGLENGGTATLTNCTFSNDSATSSSTGGGGISNAGGAILTLTNCTLANNAAVNGSGGGIWNAQDGTLNLTNTLVAENTAAVSGPDVSGDVSTADHDLIGDGSGSTIITNLGGNLEGTSTAPIDPRLGPLQNNGGPTQTLALLADSPAIGHANNAKAPATDQRGFTRLDETGETTDIGAFEF